MKEEDLIKYREKLLHYYKYESYCGYDSNRKKTDSKSIKIKDIKNSIATESAVQSFERALEEFLKTMIVCGIDFDIIEIRINNDLFLSEYFKNKVDNSKSLHERIDAKKGLTKEDILPNITRTSISFRALIDGNVVYSQQETIVLGCIEYDKFVNLIEALGYSVSIKTFNELSENLTHNPAYSTDSTIKVNFAQQQQRTPKR